MYSFHKIFWRHAIDPFVKRMIKEIDEEPINHKSNYVKTIEKKFSSSFFYNQSVGNLLVVLELQECWENILGIYLGEESSRYF